VGDSTRLGPFVADDSFLRHIDRKKRLMDDGTIAPEAFKPRNGETSLSFTFQNKLLNSEAGLEHYQRDKVLQSGDLPGICKLTFYDLTQALEPPLPPRSVPEPRDEKYGHLHCCTDCPRDQIHMAKMAKLATRNGVLRPFVRSGKRKR
jgi:hypothetical protein